MRSRSAPAVAVLALLAVSVPAAAHTQQAAGGINNVLGNPIPTAAEAENGAQLVRQFDVEINNSAGGAIVRVNPNGDRVQLGTVERPAVGTTLANNGFWASKYSRAVDGTAGHVLATSVYVLRMKVGPDQPYDPTYYADWQPGDPTDWTTSLINLRPDGYHELDQDHWLPDTIYTDIPGGAGIFGGPAAPPVGSPLTYHDGDQWRPITDYFAGDFNKPAPERLRFTVYRPDVDGRGSPTYLELENWAAGDTVAGVTHEDNGRILLGYADGAPKHIADVMQRVEGIGRFGGTELAQVGQVDTNHPGALTLSTSPYSGVNADPDQLGGLQIVPANHVKWLSYRLGQNSFIGLPQWLIVGPIGADASLLDEDLPYVVDGRLSVYPGWEAIAPIFGMYVRTTFRTDDPAHSTRFVVSTDHGTTWQPSPTLTGVQDPTNCTQPLCVHHWTNIRIYLTYG